jgi:hypothetical protein
MQIPNEHIWDTYAIPCSELYHSCSKSLLIAFRGTVPLVSEAKLCKIPCKDLRVEVFRVMKIQDLACTDLLV